MPMPTTTLDEALTSSVLICQGCKRSIRPGELVDARPAPDGSTWYLHHSITQCLTGLVAALRRKDAAE